MEMSRVLRVIQVIVNFFLRICSFGPYFIWNNVVLETHCFLQGPEFWEVIEGAFIQGGCMSFVDCSLWKTHNQIIGRSFEGPLECENREQMSKSLLNRLVTTQAAMYFNPAGLWMWEFGFLLLEKRDPLCGVVEPSEEFDSVVPKVCRL